VKASVGDRLVVSGHSVGEAERSGEIVEVRGPGGRSPVPGPVAERPGVGGLSGLRLPDRRQALRQARRAEPLGRRRWPPRRTLLAAAAR
jgi:Domain of unknown function (DUF1918)